MADDEQGEKRHEASEKKLTDAAKRGQIVKSSELSSATVLLVGAVTLAFAIGPAAETLEELIRSSWSLGVSPTLDSASAAVLVDQALVSLATALALPMGALVVGVLVVGFAQTRFQLATEALEPKPERLDPIAGAKQKFLSWTPLVELFKGVAKLAALSVIVYLALRSHLGELPLLATLSAAEQLTAFRDLGWTIVLWSLPLLLIIGVVDYAYNHWKLHDDLKMSDHEVKEERKQMDGDPRVKAIRRARARQYAMGQGIRKVAEADLIITNPTHYAVAIRYRKDEAPAPVIVAMGVDHMALKIRAEARRHGIQRIENRALARALHAEGKVGQIIPEALFAPVAKVLAVVLRRRQRR